MMKLWSELVRRRKATTSEEESVATIRCLSVVDITCLGLATTLGTGVYVLVSEAAREYAGPSVVLSVLVASVTAWLGGLCYAEVATRFSQGGSAYTYAYATTGELSAFLIGWGMVLEYSLGTALATKACTQYLDGTLNGTVSTMVENLFGKLDVPGLDRYFDVPSFLVLILLRCFLAIPLKILCTMTNVLVIVNLLVISGVVLIGVFNMEPENWTNGTGFFPNGATGVFSGAAICYFGFVGYDLMAIGSRHAVHKSRIIPTSVSIVFLIGLLATFTISAAITLFIPYSLLESRGSLLQAFALRGVLGMQYFSTLGASSGLLAAGIASTFAQIRLLQSLASDGLLFSFLKKKNCPRNSVSTSTIASLMLSSVFSLFCDIKVLVRIVGMGTLTASIAVAVSVLCSRYGVSSGFPLEPADLSRDSTTNEIHQVDQNVKESSSNNQGILLKQADAKPDYGSVNRRSLSVDYVNDSFVTCLSELSPHWGKRTPDQKSSATAAGLVAATMLVMLLMGVMTLHVPRLVAGSRMWAELTACGMFLMVVVGVVLICRQPRHRPKYHTKVSCVPVLPLCAILLDVHLLVALPSTAWMVFLVWSLLGTVLYMSYGMWHSAARKLESQSEVSLSHLHEDGGGANTGDQTALVESF